MVGQLSEGPIEPDRLVRVELDRGSEQAVAREPEHDHPGEVPEDAEDLVCALDLSAHLVGVCFLQELAREGPIALVQTDADQHGARKADDDRTAAPAHHTRRRLARVARAA